MLSTEPYRVCWETTQKCSCHISRIRGIPEKANATGSTAPTTTAGGCCTGMCTRSGDREDTRSTSGWTLGVDTLSQRNKSSNLSKRDHRTFHLSHGNENHDTPCPIQRLNILSTHGCPLLEGEGGSPATPSRGATFRRGKPKNLSRSVCSTQPKERKNCGTERKLKKIMKNSGDSIGNNPVVYTSFCSFSSHFLTYSSTAM